MGLSASVLNQHLAESMKHDSIFLGKKIELKKSHSTQRLQGIDGLELGFGEKNLEEQRSLGGLSERAPSDGCAGCGSISMAAVTLVASSLPAPPQLPTYVLLLLVSIMMQL